MEAAANKGASPGRSNLPAMLTWTLLVLAGLLPIALLSLYAFRVTSRSIAELVRSNTRSAAQMAAELVRSDLDSSIDFAKGVASMPDMIDAVGRRDVQAVRERLRLAMQAFPRVDRAMALDCEGVLWADYPAAPESLERNFAYRDYFRGLSRAWKPYVSEVFLRQAKPQRMVVAVAVPIVDRDKKVLGALVLQHRLEEVTQWVKEVGVGQSGYVFLIDHHGNVAAHPKLDLQARRYADYAALPAVRTAMDGAESTVEYQDPLARQSMVATFLAATVADQRWVVVAQQPSAEVYAPVRQLRLQLIAAAAILALVALAVVLGLGQIRQQLQRANRRLFNERQLLKDLLDVYEQHRQLVAYEIHDGLAQPLTAAIMSFEALKSMPVEASAAIKERFASALELLRDSLAETRRLMSGLRPQVLDDFGILAAVEHLVKASRITSSVQIDYSQQVAFDRLAAPLETALYRIVQEGLTNALRHSKSARVAISMVQEGQRIRLVIEDWGCGFDPQQVDGRRFGLRGIRQRAELFGGQATIDSQPGKGTRVSVDLPIVEAAPSDPEE
ncbi:MAG: cache domain-containing protein [Thermoguttaceae bacterium]